MEIIIIGLCLWAIALEWKLRERDSTVHTLCAVLGFIADGTAKARRDNGTVRIQLTNKGVK